MRLITAKQAAELLNVRLPRLYELARLGQVPSVRLGEKSIRFDEAALREWIERGGVNQGTSAGIERNGGKQ
jgi:excisionase family DNA binding protein